MPRRYVVRKSGLAPAPAPASASPGHEHEYARWFEQTGRPDARARRRGEMARRKKAALALACERQEQRVVDACLDLSRSLGDLRAEARSFCDVAVRSARTVSALPRLDRLYHRAKLKLADSIRSGRLATDRSASIEAALTEYKADLLVHSMGLPSEHDWTGTEHAHRLDIRTYLGDRVPDVSGLMRSGTYLAGMGQEIRAEAMRAVSAALRTDPDLSADTLAELLVAAEQTELARRRRLLEEARAAGAGVFGSPGHKRSLRGKKGGKRHKQGGSRGSKQGGSLPPDEDLSEWGQSQIAVADTQDAVRRTAGPERLGRLPIRLVPERERGRFTGRKTLVTE